MYRFTLFFPILINGIIFLTNFALVSNYSTLFLSNMLMRLAIFSELLLLLWFQIVSITFSSYKTLLTNLLERVQFFSSSHFNENSGKIFYSTIFQLFKCLNIQKINFHFFSLAFFLRISFTCTYKNVGKHSDLWSKKFDEVFNVRNFCLKQQKLVWKKRRSFFHIDYFSLFFVCSLQQNVWERLSSVNLVVNYSKNSFHKLQIVQLTLIVAERKKFNQSKHCFNYTKNDWKYNTHNAKVKLKLRKRKSNK